MLFYASAAAREPGGVPPTLVISAEAWHDAKQIALVELGEEGLLFQETGEDATPDIEIKWEGTDAREHNGRKRFVRKKRGAAWGKWEER